MTHKDWEVGFRGNEKEEWMVNAKSWGTRPKNLLNPGSCCSLGALLIHLGWRKLMHLCYIWVLLERTCFAKYSINSLSQHVGNRNSVGETTNK